MGGIHRFYGILQNPWKNVLGTRPVLVFVNQFVKPDETLDKAMTTAVRFLHLSRPLSAFFLRLIHRLEASNLKT